MIAGDGEEQDAYVLGVDVPLYTANGHQTYYIADGSLKEYWTALDFHFLREEAKVNLPDYQPDLPMYVAEFWSGRGQQWGGYFTVTVGISHQRVV